MTMQNNPVPQDGGFHLLLLDDNEGWRQTVRELLETSSPAFRVQEASTPEEANHLIGRQPFDAVVVDIRLSDNGRKQPGYCGGDEWIDAKREQLAGSLVVAVTGYPGDIKDRDRLRARGVRIIRKADTEEDYLWQELRGRAEEKVALIGSKRAEVESLDDSIIDLFSAWAARFVDQDSKDVHIGIEDYSVRDLMNEVRKRTPVGATVLQLFVRQVKRRLGLSDVKRH